MAKKTTAQNRYLIVVDVQNDFVTGALGSPEAEAIVAPLVQKVKEYPGDVILTLDTHHENYMDTQEGQYLPIPHCIENTPGWQPVEALAGIGARRYQKPTFASAELARDLLTIHTKSPIEEIELVGLCTDICVVSNALMLKGFMPEVPIYVDASCCVGTTPEKHEAALKTMESCQIQIKNR